MQRIIGHLIAASQIMRNFLPQLLQTGIGSVKGTSLFQRINALVADVPGSIEVRLADTQEIASSISLTISKNFRIPDGLIVTIVSERGFLMA